MNKSELTAAFHWRCRHTWRTASYNTLWCLIGCSIGDMGTILFFQLSGIDWPVMAIMSLAIINGLITSIILETVILSRQMALKAAFQTAIGMSLISMIADGNGDESCRLLGHGRGQADPHRFAAYVGCRFFNAPAL